MQTNVADATRAADFPARNGRFQRHRYAADVEADLRALMVSDNWHGLLAWCEDVAVIAGCVAACLVVSAWLYPLAALVIGARQRGLSTILHDSAHGVVARDHRLNLLLGTVLTAYPIFQQHYSYKASHVLTHHPFLGDPDRDPDLRFFIQQGAYRRGSRRSLVWRLVVLPAIGWRTVAYLRYLVTYRLRNIRTRTPARTARATASRLADRLAFATFWVAVLAVAAWSHALTAVVVWWVVPYLTSFQILGWYIEISEHTPLIEYADLDLYMTRNRKSRGLERFLTGIHNDHYHLDHHLHTKIPFWNLPRANAVRRRDPAYAAVDAATGGLFTRGPDGVPSALARIVRELTVEAA